MKRFSLFTSSVLCIILGMNPAVRAGTNVWTSVGPDGGRIQAITVDPQNPGTVYAVAGGGIFKTTDGAASWNRVYSPATSDGKVNYPATLVAVDPQDSNTLYAGTSTAGVFKSTDGGASWSMANRGLPKPTSYPNNLLTTFTTSYSVGALAIDPQNPETIYAGVNPNWDGPLPSTPAPTLFKSTDGGASWNAANSGLTADLVNYDGSHFTANLNVYSLAINPQDSNTLYAAGNVSNSGGIFKSTDGGASWRASFSHGFGIAISPGIAIVAIDPQDSNTLYAAGDGIFKSTDGGASWSAANSGLPEFISSLAIDPQNSGTLYASPEGGCSLPACTYGQVFRSTDGGTSWADTGLASSPTSSVSSAFLAIDPINSNTVYAGTYDGLMKSLDAGSHWNAADSGLTASEIDSLAIDPQNAGAFLAISRGKVLGTADGGAHWNVIYTPLPTDDGLATYPASVVVADPSAPGTLYVAIGGNGDGGGGILKSTDAGASWNRMPLPGRGGVGTLSMDPQNPGTLYAAVPYHAVYKSTDGAATWNKIAGRDELKEDPTGEPIQGFGSVLVDPRNPSTLYVGIYGSGGGLLKSIDGGQTWSLLTIPTEMTFSGIVAIDPQLSGTLYVWDYYAGVLKTTDGGQNWKAFTSGLPATGIDIRFIAVDPRNSNIVYAAAVYSGLFWSTNGGASWSPLNTGLTNLDVEVLLIDPRDPYTLYAGTYDGGVFAMTFFPQP